MYLTNQNAYFQGLRYIALYLVIQSVFSWEVPGCGRTNSLVPQARITSGSSLKPGDAPWMVYITMDNKFQCGGTIIQPRWILTAGHCLLNEENMPYSQYNVYAGLTSRSEALNGRSGQRPKVKQVIIHENYTRIRLKSDIALIELETPLEFNEHVSAICQPRNDWLPSTAIAMGWGYDEYNRNQETLQMAELKLLSSTRCSEFHRPDDTLICAGDEDTDVEDRKSICSGDSGGPLVAKVERNTSPVWVLVGVISGASNRGCRAKPGKFTRVGTFHRWISLLTDSRVITQTPEGANEKDTLERATVKGTPERATVKGIPESVTAPEGATDPAQSGSLSIFSARHMELILITLAVSIFRSGLFESASAILC